MTDDFNSGLRAGIEKAADLILNHPFHKTNNGYKPSMKTAMAARILALLPEGAEGWRSDMENAPRDRAILVWRKSQLMVARWDDDHYANKPRPFWNCLSVWGRRDERDEPPTHWRPMLPSPPTGKGE